MKSPSVSSGMLNPALSNCLCTSINENCVNLQVVYYEYLQPIENKLNMHSNYDDDDEGNNDDQSLMACTVHNFLRAHC